MSEQEPRGLLRGRGIDPSSLDGAGRRIILTTYIVLLALAFATAIRESLGSLGDYGTQVSGILLPKAVAWIAAAGAAIAVTLLLSGAAYARSRWRYLLVAPALIAPFASMFAGPHKLSIPFSPTTQALFFIPAVWLVGCAVIVMLAPRLRARQVIIYIAALVSAFAATIIVLSITLWPTYGPTALLTILFIGANCLMVPLAIVGWDLAEIGLEVADTGVKRMAASSVAFARLIRWGLIVAVIVGGIYLNITQGYARFEGRVLIGISAAAIVLAIAGGVWLALRRPDDLVGHLKYRHVALLAILLAAIWAASQAFTDLNPRFFNHPRGHVFSMRLPKTMSENLRAHYPRTEDMETPYHDSHLEFFDNRAEQTLIIAALIRPPFRPVGIPMPSAKDLIGQKGMTFSAPRYLESGERGWRAGAAQGQDQLTGGRYAYSLFKLEADTGLVGTDLDWYIICGARDSDIAKSRVLCTKIKDSFQFNVRDRPARRALIIIDVAIFLAAAIAYAFSVLRVARSRGPWLDLLFWTLWLTGLNQIGGYAFGSGIALFEPHFSADLCAAVMFASALVGLTVEVWPKSRIFGFDISETRLLTARLSATLCILAIILYLYVVAASHSEHSQAIRGFVICLALTWELAAAGPTVNANTGAAFPQSSRILLFVGYLVLVATTVFMFGELQTIYGSTFAAFDTEGIVAGGLVLIGIAFAIVQFLRGLSRRRAAEVLEPGMQA